MENYVNFLELFEDDIGKSLVSKMKSIKCALLTHNIRSMGIPYDMDQELKCGFTTKQFDELVNKVNSLENHRLEERQEVYFEIWMKDGSYYSLSYDLGWGKYEWIHHCIPPIPDSLKD